MNEGIAAFKVDILRISKFIVGEPGEDTDQTFETIKQVSRNEY